MINKGKGIIMKIKYFVIILLLLTMNIFCEHFNEYIFEVVHRIPSGEKDVPTGANSVSVMRLRSP